MKILISPAKSLNFDQKIELEKYTTPVFERESQLLINKLKKLSRKKVGNLMKISDQLAELNYNRFQEWSLPFTKENSKQAGYVFTGEVYKGLSFETLSQENQSVAQEKLRILSGLYGVLKPLDLIQPYRLEMGTRLEYSTKIKNLYQFWDTKITDLINEELDDQNRIIINLASNEYFKSVKVNHINGEIITCNFKENKNDTYKIVMMYAKNARGKMARFIIENNLKDKNDLRAFNDDGYSFNNELSNKSEYIFTRG